MRRAYTGCSAHGQRTPVRLRYSLGMTRLSSDENADTLLAAGATSPAPATRESSPLRVGERVERYTVLERLGAGGMGVVYAAYDPTLDRKVALKVLHTTSRDSAAQARARLEREARALARLHHPNVVTVYEIGMVAGHVFLAMELVEGRSLAEWHSTPEARDWRRVIEIYLAAGRGLAAAHAAGLVHRDFKPANVLLGSDGRVVVTDFGLARLTSGATPLQDAASVPSSAAWGMSLADLRSDAESAHPRDPTDSPDSPAAPDSPDSPAAPAASPDSLADTGAASPLAGDVSPGDSHARVEQRQAPRDAHADDADEGLEGTWELPALAGSELAIDQLTRTGMVLGTPAYMAPEQHNSEAVDARTDQFSFCVSLHESLYGMRPFAGATPDALRDAIRAGRVADPPRRSAVPQRVRRVLLRGLRADPDQRYPRMHALLGALERAAWPRARRLLAPASLAAIAVTAIAVAIAAAVLVGGSRAAAPDASCAVDLTGAWDPQVSANVRAALSGRPDFEGVFGQVTAHLDAGAAAWHEARDRICAAEATDPDPGAGAGAGLFHHRMGCLLDYRDQVASLTELLSAGDERASTFVVSATRALPDPTRCVALAPHSASFALPRDPAQRAEVARLRADLARAVTAFYTASFERATELANEVLTGARALGDRYLEAAALYWRGQGRAMRYDRAAIDEDVAETVLIAEEQGYPDLLARALVTTAAFRVLDPAVTREGMQELLRRAHAAVERLGDAGELGGWLALLEGYHSARYADTASAVAAFGRARTLFQQAGNHFKAARVDAYWGMSLYANGRQREAEERLAAALAVLGPNRAALEAQPYEIVCGLGLVIDAAERLERYEDARRIHEFLDRRCPHHAPPQPAGPVRAVRGRVLDAAGQPVAGALVMARRGLHGNGRYALQSIDTDSAAMTHADHEGEFAFDRLSDEPLVLVAETEAGRSFPVPVGPGALAGVIAELRPYGSVRGRLGGHGEDAHPGRERMIALLPAAPEAPYRAMLLVPVRLDGTFRVERLAAGRYHLSLSENRRDPMNLRAGRWQPLRDVEVAPDRVTEIDLPAPAPATAPTTSLTVQVHNRFEGELPLAHIWALPGAAVPGSIAGLHARWYDGVTALHFAVATAAQAAPEGTARPGDRWHRFVDLPIGDLVVCAVPLGNSAPYAVLLGYPPELDLYCRSVTAAEQLTGQPVIIDAAPMKRRP
jgi:serine/threonine protein kinase/tetratricopeptide (TPR) repeat protein